MPKSEKRSALLPRSRAAIESRADGDAPVLISGYGAVYYNSLDPESEYRVDYDLVERFRPGCFDKFLASDRDCFCAPFHDERRVLGRRSRLLTLSSDAKGLRYSVPYDSEDPDHVTIGAKIRRGDVSGASISFAAIAEEWRRDEVNQIVIREVIEAELLHVGPVVGEAYAGTTAEIRTDAGGNWNMLQERKAAFLAAESQGVDELLFELDYLLLP